MNNNLLYVFYFFSILFSLPAGYAFCQKVDLVLQQSHTQPVSAMCFTPDNKYLITGGEDKLIKIWEIKSGLLLKTLYGHTSTVLSISCFHKGDFFISSSSDSTIKIWSIDTDEPINSIKTTNNSVKKVYILPDDNTILFYGEDSLINVYNLSLNENMKSFKDNEGSIKYAALSPDSKYIASGNSNGQLKVWDIKSGNCIKNIKIGEKLLCVRYTSDNNNILVYEVASKSIFKIDTKCWKISKLLSYAPRNYFSLSINNQYLYLLPDMCYDLINHKFYTLSKDINELKNDQKNIFVFQSVEDYPTLCFSDDNSLFASSNKYVFNALAITIKLWHISNYYNFNLIRELSNRTENIYCMDISKNGHMIAFGGWDNRIKYCDIKHLRIYKVFSKCDYPIEKVEFLNSDFLSVYTTYNKELGFCDTSREIRPFYQKNLVGIFGLREDKYIYIIDSIFEGNYYHYNISIFDIKKSHVIRNIKFDFKNKINKIEILNDYSCFIILDENNSLILWDIDSNGAIFFTQKLDYQINDIKCLYNEKFFYLACSNGAIYKLDLIKLKEIRTFKDSNSVSINKLSISKDGKIMAYCDNSIKILDQDLNHLSSLSILPEYNYGSQLYKYVNFRLTNDNKYIISPNQNTIKLTKTENEYEFIKLIPVDSTELFVLTNDNYFMSTKGAINTIGYRVDNRIFSFEQFDIQYNRPDIVMERIGLADTSLIKAYRRAYYNRLKKLNFDTTNFNQDFHLPEINIINEKSIDQTTSEKIIKLNIKATDSKYKLDRINVWINEVPLFGINGKSIKNLNKSEYECKINLELSDSINIIQVSTINEKTVESLRKTIFVIYKPEKLYQAKTYFIGIGVSNYHNSVFNLNYADKDIKNLDSIFCMKYANNYESITLLNKQVTKENILKIRESLLKTNVNDLVIIALSGHGVLNNNRDFYYATYNMNFYKPEKYGLIYDDLDKLLDSIPARKKVLFIDACNSGEVEKEQITENKEQTAKDKEQITEINIKGFEPESYKELQKFSKLGLSNSFQLMQEIFVNLSRGNGAVVLSAARGYESAFESKSFGNGNGAFTSCILEGLKDRKADLNNNGIITISELKEFVLKSVEELTNGKQKPTSRQENIMYDFRVW